MLLMGVLMTLMLPAFKRMISGNKVDQIASNLKLGLEQARSQAISNRRYVALILPNNNSVWSHPSVKEYCLGGFRQAFVKKMEVIGSLMAGFPEPLGVTVRKEPKSCDSNQTPGLHQLPEQLWIEMISPSRWLILFKGLAALKASNSILWKPILPELRPEVIVP